MQKMDEKDKYAWQVEKRGISKSYLYEIDLNYNLVSRFQIKDAFSTSENTQIKQNKFTLLRELLYISDERVFQFQYKSFNLVIKYVGINDNICMSHRNFNIILFYPIACNLSSLGPRVELAQA